MTLLYKTGSLQGTIFEHAASLQFLHENGIALTDDVYQADIFILRALLPHIEEGLAKQINKDPHNGRPILVWTHEPRFTLTDQELVYVKGFPIHIMNVYTRNVYFSNFTHYGAFVDCNLSPVTDVIYSERPIAGLATYVYPERQQFILNGVDIDLAVKRQNLMYEAFHMGMIDIYGRDWPESIRVSESRGPGWHDKKINILKPYQFNICMENTAYDYYCTEKIWDSIKSYCLPVYSGMNNKIYENFPKNSFIDYHEFGSDKELLLFIKSMSKKEYLFRMNLCIETFNRIYATVDFKKEKQKALEAVVAKIKSISSATRTSALSNQ